ncbi:MAG: XdhC family protein [Acidobacteria bacterium]|nr:XdhC family protein [Acidobacteriota bacterium]MCA1639019.1 XdhC family protein [Acidobacteriota bacterium]
MNKELQEIINQFERLESLATRTVLATVVDVKGSSYRLPGARMLIGENGEMFGTVSGGCLEADVLERASRVLQTGEAEVFTYDTTAQEDSVFSLNMGCRGLIRILLERPDVKLIDFFRTLYAGRLEGLVATFIESNSEKGNVIKVGRRLLLNTEIPALSDFTPEIQEKILPDCLAALRRKQSKHLTTEFGEFFLEFIAPPTSLLIFGAGFDAIPLAEIAKNLGWHATMLDHRAAFANRERFPRADEIIITHPENLTENLTVDENTVAVVMTHNYEHDKNILRFLLNSSARYIGALGPKRRTENILSEWREAGVSFSAVQLDKLYAPIGLDIGADTPEAISLSIVAEIKSVLANRAGGFLRERKGSIYNRNAAA